MKFICWMFHDWDNGFQWGAGIIYTCKRCGKTFYKGSMD